MVSEVVAFDRDSAACAEAMRLGIADRIAATPAEAVREADLVLLAVPVGAMGEVMAACTDALPGHAWITDVGSTKGSVIRDLGPLVPPGVHLIPAHPMAGTRCKILKKIAK